jgi:parallel beta-helix repeat protein
MILIRKKITIYILFFVLISISGCVVEKNDNENTNNPYIRDFDFFVNKDYSSETNFYNQTHFSSINSALEKSEENTSIFVFNGTYHEFLVVNKDIILIGEDPFNTIIDGAQQNEDVIHIQGKGKLTISGFTIMNSSKNAPHSNNEAGIDIRSKGNIIEGNIITDNYYGIYCPYNNNNIIKNNLFTNNLEYGAYFLYQSNKNNISHNLFDKNDYIALRIQGSQSNNITHNLFINNPKGLYLCCNSKDNVVYENVFINNSDWNAFDDGINFWDNGKKGNYWDDFHLNSQGAFDNNSDGIVDSSYSIPFVKNNDTYPLVNIPTILNDFYNKNSLSIINENK